MVFAIQEKGHPSSSVQGFGQKGNKVKIEYSLALLRRFHCENASNMFSVHTTPEEFKNTAAITNHFGFVLEVNLASSQWQVFC